MRFPWHYALMAIMYIMAGIFHFLKPKAYLRIMPRYLPKPKFLVYLSGFVEIIVGVLLFSSEHFVYAIYAVLLMLLAFIPVHIYMLTNKKAGMGLPHWLLVLRIPLQFLLMYWAWSYL